MLIAYPGLLCEFFWEFSIFHFCRPQVYINWHPLLSAQSNLYDFSVRYILIFLYLYILFIQILFL